VRILVVDDDEQLRRALRINLEARDHSVTEASSGPDAVELAALAPDLVILDLGLPGLSGTRVVSAVRAVSTAPILVLSGRTQSADKVEALDAGANDYVTKPFSIDELLARIRALTRAAPGASAEPVEFGRVRVDLDAHEIDYVEGDGRPKLTPTEWGVLELLLRNPDRLVTKRELLTTVWDPARPRHLITEPGLGYRFSQRGR
jgi:two-component system KDP operon response regulator KdpE